MAPAPRPVRPASRARTQKRAERATGRSDATSAVDIRALLELDRDRAAVPKKADTAGAPSQAFLKSHAHTAFLIVLPVVVIVFLAVVLVEQHQIAQLSAKNAELQEQIETLEVQNAFYRKAYEITLDDIKQLSKNYGGEEQYEALAQELRDQGLAVSGVAPSEPQDKAIKSTTVWSTYVAAGVIKTECLPRALADTVTDEVLLSVDLQGNGDARIYLDANPLEVVAVQGVANRTYRISLSQGAHALDIISGTGGVTVAALRFDAAEIGISQAALDYGEQWQVFDCLDVGAGTSLERPGALRMLIEKA